MANSSAKETAMIEQIEGLPAGTLGFRAHGQVTAADYERVIVPDVEAAFALNRRLRVLYITAADFTGFDPGAMWDDAKLGMRHFSGWDRVALVSDVPWLRTTTSAMSFMIPAEIRLFHLSEQDEAKRWITESAA
jgi:SpoIIAA-like